jgi:hypothetical protein
MIEYSVSFKHSPSVSRKFRLCKGPVVEWLIHVCLKGKASHTGDVYIAVRIVTNDSMIQDECPLVRAHLELEISNDVNLLLQYPHLLSGKESLVRNMENR